MIEIFTVFLCVVSIYFFIKNKFPSFFCALYLFLPEFYALELSEALPLVTFRRVLLVALFIYWIMKFRKYSIRYNFSYNTYLLLSFFIRILANTFYLFTYAASVKNIFSIVVEEFLLLIVILNTLRDKKDVSGCLKVLVYVSGVVFAFGIVESFTGVNWTSFLYNVNRSLPNTYALRLGLLRSTFSFGIPTHYAMFCSLMIPFIIHCYEEARKKIFLLIMLLNIFATIFSGSRANILTSMFIIFLCFLKTKKENKKRFILSGIFVTLITLIIIILLSILDNRMNYYFSGTAKSMLNIIGFHFDLNKGAPDGVKGYGGNAENAVYSRVFQLSGAYYALKRNFLFGLGSGAANRGEIFYYYKTAWKQVSTYDIGYIAIIIDEGVLGLTAFIFLFVYLIKSTIHNIKNKINIAFNYTFIIFIIDYLLCIVTCDNQFDILWLVIALFVAFNYQENGDNTSLLISFVKKCRKKVPKEN